MLGGTRFAGKTQPRRCVYEGKRRLGRPDLYDAIPRSINNWTNLGMGELSNQVTRSLVFYLRNPVLSTFAPNSARLLVRRRANENTFTSYLI
jgi:hypothetical protein